MSEYSQNPFVVAADAAAVDRAQFIRRTYIHTGVAILLFALLEAALINIPGIERLIYPMVSGYGWLIVLAAFMGVSWVADKWARSDAGQGQQYLGLGLYIVAEAIIFLPLIYMAAYMTEDPTLIPTAGIITGLLFLGITATAFMTRKDFSFLGGVLGIGGFVAMGVIICSIIFGFTLGLLFSAIMVLFAGGAILYTTSNIIHHYRTDQYVAASLALFSGVMLLFWYVLQILMRARR